MKVRTINLEDVAQFEQIGMEADNKPILNLNKWLDVGRTKLEWCFVIEEEGQFLGRVNSQTAGKEYGGGPECSILNIRK